MPEETGNAPGNPLIVMGDKIAPKPHLTAFLKDLRTKNAMLDPEAAIVYAVCWDSHQIALTLSKHLDNVKMILIGPGLVGNGVTVARMLGSKAHIVMVVDPTVNPLGPDPKTCTKIQHNLEALGVIIVLAKDATDSFYQPLIQKYVLSGLTAGTDFGEMSPEERAAMIDKRLEAVNSFPSLPDTQRKVAELDDQDPPKKWAEAIDPDLPTKTVILKILNSARYGFRSRVETIDQAVALASAKTIREIVTACQIRQIFSKTEETTIDQFWRHSLAVGFMAKLLSLPADPAEQDSQQKTEFERYQLEQEQIDALQEAKLWQKLDLGPKDDLFTAGLLHDIGKVSMQMCLEDSLEFIMAVVESEVQEAQAQSKLWANSVIDIERQLMKDLDHQVIGGRIAEKWELDDSLQAVVTCLHDIQEHSPGIVKAVAFANMAANCFFPYPAAETQHPFPQLFARIDAAVKKSSKSGPEAIEEAIHEEIFEDLVDVLNRLKIPSFLWELTDFRTFFKLAHILSPKIKAATIGFLQQTGG